MPKMPVIDSMAPITPSTPSEIVAMRGPNRTASISLIPRLDEDRQARIQLPQRAPDRGRQPVWAHRARGAPPDTSSSTAIAGWEETSPACGSSVRLCILSVFRNTHHLDARSIRHLEVAAHGASVAEPKILRANSAIHHGHAWRILIVVPGEVPAGQQGRARGMEVFGRDAVTCWRRQRRSMASDRLCCR